MTGYIKILNKYIIIILISVIVDFCLVHLLSWLAVDEVMMMHPGLGYVRVGIDYLVRITIIILLWRDFGREQLKGKGIACVTAFFSLILGTAILGFMLLDKACKIK